MLFNPIQKYMLSYFFWVKIINKYQFGIIYGEMAARAANN